MHLSGVRLATLTLTGVLSCLPLAAQSLISAKSGLIHFTEGDVKIGEQAAAPNNGIFQSLAVGKELTTGEGRAEMLLAPGQFLRLNENSAVRMLSNKLDSTRLDVVRGSVLVEVIDMAKNAPISLTFGSNAIELRKDGLYRIDSDPARLRVYEGEAVATGNGQTLTVKKDRELSMGTVFAENHFDAVTGDEFSRWAQRRAGYVATANVSAARDAYSDGANSSANMWSFNPWYGMYTYLPNNRMYMSPFGFYYFSPDFAYNDGFWPYLGGGYGFYGAGAGYGYGLGYNSSCGSYLSYGCGYGYGASYGNGYGYGSGYGAGSGGGGGTVSSPLRPVRGLPPTHPIGNRGGPLAGSRGMTSSTAVTRGSGAGPVRGSGGFGNGGGYSTSAGSGGGGGGFSRASGGSSSSGTVAAPCPALAPAAGQRSKPPRNFSNGFFVERFMDILQQLGTALGIGLLSGIRLYLTILALGSAIRFHWIVLEQSQNGLAILADWRVMTVTAVACGIEFVADKVPWVDSMWDSIHTFIRPIGAAILGARAFMHTDPAVQAILAILCGGLALSGHSAKAATRLAVNHSPEPFSNVALSLAGDAAVPVATWAAFHFPLFTFGCVVVFAIVFGWLAPHVFRAIRLEMAALHAALGRWFGGPDSAGVPILAASAMPAEFAAALRPLPEGALSALRGKTGTPRFGMGVRAAATKSIRGLNHSLGYLCLTGVQDATDAQIVFVTRRLLSGKLWSSPVADIQSATWSSGIFFDKLYLKTTNGEVRFDILKAAARKRAVPAMAAASQG
jgi:hypothetical protein